MNFHSWNPIFQNHAAKIILDLPDNVSPIGKNAYPSTEMLSQYYWLFFGSKTFALFYSRVGDVERKLREAEAREEALLRRITEKEKALNKMR